MSYISDFKGAAFSLFGVNGGTTSNDASLATQVGQRFNTADYREVVLVQNGATALVAGNLIQAPASIGANHTGLAVVTTNWPIGATSIQVTAGGTAITANQYQGGFAVISAGTGLGQTLRIASNSSATSSGTCTIVLEDPLSVALTTSTSKVSLTLNPYGSQFGTALGTSGVIISPTTATGTTVGVTIYPIPATTTSVLSYGFIQTRGLVACLNDATTAIGLDLMPSTNTAGAVMTYVVATRNRVGTASIAGETTKAQLISIQL